MKKKIIYLALALAVTITLFSCSGMTVGTGFGLNFSSGPYGTSVSPSFNIGFSGGYGW